MPEVADKPHPYMTPMERDMSGSEKPSFSGALAVGRELDLLLPDSPAVRDAYAQAEAASQPWLFNHVMRSWLYGAKHYALQITRSAFNYTRALCHQTSLASIWSRLCRSR